jgi:hypothetical protein
MLHESRVGTNGKFFEIHVLKHILLRGTSSGNLLELSSLCPLRQGNSINPLVIFAAKPSETYGYEL